MTKREKYIKGSGNVYEDLGFQDAGERLAKANLAIRISDVIDKQGYNQTQAGEVLGVNQPKISALINGQLDGFSMERLIGFLIKLDQDIEIVVKPHTPKCYSTHKLPHVRVRCSRTI